MSNYLTTENYTNAPVKSHHSFWYILHPGDILALQELSEFQEGFSEADDRGWYPLHKAAVQPLVKMLEIVLCASFRLSLEEKTMEGETLLTPAAMAGLVDNVKMILEHGACCDFSRSAVRLGLYEMASALITRGACVEQVCLKQSTALHEAAKLGYSHIMELLFEHGGQVSEIDQDGVTPMPLQQSTNDNKQKLDFLSLQLGGNVNAPVPNGDSMLYDAAQSGNPDCIDFLLRHGANPNVPSLCSELPIHRTAYEELTFLYQVTDNFYSDRRAIRLSGQSSVHSAADGVHVQCLELLVEKSFDVNSLLDFHISEDYRDMRKSALYFTVSNGDVTCTEMLLNTGDKTDLAALFCLLGAVRDGQYEIVKLLLARQADINCYFSVVGDTVFPPALQYCLRDEMMMRLLLNNGYDADKCFCCTHDKKFLVSWLVHLAGRAVWILLDYVSHVRGHGPLKTQTTFAPEPETSLLSYFSDQAKPRSLTHLCRLVIRKQMTQKDWRIQTSGTPPPSHPDFNKFTFK
uniref:Ankyrin repeat and SOCS box containing 15 n=1 Tax=Salmo trutta TaxID=8032 RepID=A0A673XHV8_SALTR